MKKLREGGLSVKQLVALKIPPRDILSGGYSLKEMMVELDVDSLKQAGFTAKDLAQHGAPATEVKWAYGLKDALQAGFRPDQLRDCSARRVSRCGLTCCDRSAEVPAVQLRAAGFSDNALAAAACTYCRRTCVTTSGAAATAATRRSAAGSEAERGATRRSTTGFDRRVWLCARARAAACPVCQPLPDIDLIGAVYGLCDNGSCR